MYDRTSIRDGMTVFSSDGEKLGKVISCDADGFLVEKGFFFPKEYFVRYEHAARVEGDDLWLSLERDRLLEAGDSDDRLRREGYGVHDPALDASRRSSDRDLGMTRDATGRDEVRTTLPIPDEEVEIRRRPVVKRDRVQHEQRADAEVRRETFDIDDGDARRIDRDRDLGSSPGLGAPGKDDDLLR